MPLTFEVAEVDVVNEALGQLGKDPVNNIDDTEDPVAVKARRYFISTLRTMLRDHDWNFARERAELAASATAPISGFAYSFPLPADCLFVRRLNGTDHPAYPWKIEGRNLLTDVSEALIEYTKWITDPNIWDGGFYQAMVTFLAVRFAPAFDVNTAKASDLYKLFSAQLWDAKAIDSQEGSPEQIVSTVLTDDIRDE